MAAMVGVAAGLTTILLVRFETPIAWTWYVMIGTVATFVAALAASLSRTGLLACLGRDPESESPAAKGD
jgi:hypothetical protein